MDEWFNREMSRPHPDVEKLAGLMRAIEDLLRTAHDTDWAEEVGRCATLVEQSDVCGLDRFLKLYGGAGSINDIVLYRDGVLLPEETDRLQRLLGEARGFGRSLQT